MTQPSLIIPYDPYFLGDGFHVPMPTLTAAARARALEGGRVFDYTHYSLVMARERRTAMFAANNIDAAHKVQISGGLTWKMDERVGEHQLGPDTYVDNQIDKGHLVRREDVLWGSVAEARAANAATYFYSNATPQHKNFNQDEWKALEDWVLAKAPDFSYRLCVLTGTVLTDSDPTLMDLPPELRALVRPARLPAAFWKVIVLRDGSAGGDDLAAVAFALKQSDAWNDLHGRRLLKLKACQVTLEAIEAWTGLDFGGLKQVDELAADLIRTRAIGGMDAWPAIESAEDIIWSGAERRARGLRAVRGRLDRSPRLVRSAKSTGGCTSCGTGDFDARKAIAALSDDIAGLTAHIAALELKQASSVAAGKPLKRAGRSATRSIVAPTGGGGDHVPSVAVDEDLRIAEMVDAAPAAMADQIRAFARTVVTTGRIARKEQPAERAIERLRIVGGNAVKPGGFLTCVCIGIPDWGCTGVVVAPQLVLTAAHCGNEINRIMVGGNTVNEFSKDARFVAVRRALVHPNYVPHPRSENDLSLLILDAPAMVPPMPLATTAELAAAREFEIVGFGYNDPVEPRGFGVKRQVKIELPAIMARGAAIDLGNLPGKLGFHPEYEFVAGRKMLGRDSCNGDSGGPAYILVDGSYKLAGLTSRATRTAVANCGDGGIYVQPEKFLEWINDVAAEAGVAPISN